MSCTRNQSYDQRPCTIPIPTIFLSNANPFLSLSLCPTRHVRSVYGLSRGSSNYFVLINLFELFGHPILKSTFSGRHLRFFNHERHEWFRWIGKSSKYGNFSRLTLTKTTGRRQQRDVWKIEINARAFCFSSFSSKIYPPIAYRCLTYLTIVCIRFDSILAFTVWSSSTYPYVRKRYNSTFDPNGVEYFPKKYCNVV